MPSAHRRYAEWTPARFERWAREIGPETEGLVIPILHGRPHPEQGFRTCLGILRLYRGLVPARAEAVSARANAIGALSYKGCGSPTPGRSHRQSPDRCNKAAKVPLPPISRLLLWRVERSAARSACDG